MRVSGIPQEQEPRLSFDEEAIKSKMAEIAARFETERSELKKATEKIGKREAKAQLAITFLQPDLLYDPRAKEYVQKAKDEGTKLTVSDKEAIIALELETDQIALDLAKFDCDTSKQHFDRLAPQLSFLQSEMKLG